ncbi:hypothetical protein LJC19_07805 [Oxalobacter sp. OttesenSCG-928-P03]|nr:hypothetical protein [Oxalobacter sp. OttesenSCG-928-P03]
MRLWPDRTGHRYGGGKGQSRVRRCLACVAFGVMAWPALSAAADNYHEKALIFTYERYEQILPYTMEPETAASPDTLYRLGRQCEDGDGVEKDREKAAAFYRQAAKAGHREAAWRLEEMGE